MCEVNNNGNFVQYHQCLMLGQRWPNMKPTLTETSNEQSIVATLQGAAILSLLIR